MTPEEISSLILNDNNPNLFIDNSVEEIKQDLCNKNKGFKWEEDKTLARKKFNGLDDQMYYHFVIEDNKVTSTSIEITAKSDENRSNMTRLYTDLVERLKSSDKCKFDHEGGDTDYRTSYFRYVNGLNLNVSLGNFGESTSVSVETENGY